LQLIAYDARRYDARRRRENRLLQVGLHNFLLPPGFGEGVCRGNGVCTTLKRRERLVGKTVSGVELRAWCSAGTTPAKGGGLTIGGLETGWGNSDRM